MSSTLIETVNINLEDFSESFLTCATCLCTYDQDKRKAKLLPCSHTVCLRCLEHMAQIDQVVETGVMKCPLCRDVVMIPSGGVVSFPSSFLINQLLDLMQSQRRDVQPNCSVHQQEQLLYCEQCDVVYCQQCTTQSTQSCADHTVIPFSVAIKRLSEIVVIKAKQCVSNLNAAANNVEQETVQLDQNVDRIVQQLNASFQDINQLVENRRRELLDSVRAMRDQKRKVLRDQMEMIDAHRKRLERELEIGQVDVREMGARTKRVMAATEEALALTEPRENAFLKLHTQPKTLMQEMERALSQFGTVSGSTTFPAQCTIEQPYDESASIHTEVRLRLVTADVNGKARTTGGDPVKVELCRCGEQSSGQDGLRGGAQDGQQQQSSSLSALVNDNDNGTYTISFRVCEAGEYRLCVSIFGRPIKSNPYLIRVSSHHPPLWQFGSLGGGQLQLNQPVKVGQDHKGFIYILDTGNSRIKILDSNGEYMDDVESVALRGASTVGMAILPSGEILLLNWRTKQVTKCNLDGTPLQTMTFSELAEPIDICVDSHGRILIADTKCAKIFVFDGSFRPLFSFDVSSHCGSSPITCVCHGLNDEILVGTCSALLLFDDGGRFIREISLSEPLPSSSSSSHQRSRRLMVAACAVCPTTSDIIAAVVDAKKNRAHLAVCQYKGAFAFSMDSYGSRLRRPCGISIGTHKWNGMCFVVDSATHSLKTYRFK